MSYNIENGGILSRVKEEDINDYVRRTRALSTISRQNQSIASPKLRKYVFTKTLKLVIKAPSYI